MATPAEVLTCQDAVFAIIERNESQPAAVYKR
jgi:hypothetical protein